MKEEPPAPTLRARIEQFTQMMAEHISREQLAGLADEIAKLAKSGIANTALPIGAQAPLFALPDPRGETVSLASLLARGPVVLTFYRGGWCPICDIQLRVYQAALPTIRQLHAELVAISPQTPDYARSDIENMKLSFPVLADAGNRVARQYGLVFTLSETLRAMQTALGSPLPKFNGDQSWDLPMPGTFVLDTSGTVRLAHVTASWMDRVEPAAIVAALQKLAE
jgi:peroxiredoxin